MKSLEQQLIGRLAGEVGMLKASNIELELRLAQAVQTIKALEQEVKEDGNSEQKCEAAIGTTDCNE